MNTVRDDEFCHLIATIQRIVINPVHLIATKFARHSHFTNGLGEDCRNFTLLRPNPRLAVSDKVLPSVVADPLGFGKQCCSEYN